MEEYTSIERFTAWFDDWPAGGDRWQAWTTWCLMSRSERERAAKAAPRRKRGGAYPPAELHLAQHRQGAANAARA